MTDGAPEHHDERIVLCVEDVESSALLVDRALRRIPGVRVVMARNGQEARQLLVSTRCTVVLSDLNLPDVSGAEWVAELVATVGPDGVPVVVVSADATTASKEAVLAVGATDYLTKPLDLRELMEVVGALTAAAPPAAAESESDGLPRALVDRYLAEATTDLDRVRRAIGAGDPATVESLAHRLKGSSAVFGLTDVAAMFDRLEVMARDGELSGADAVADEAAAALDRFRD